MPRQEDQLDSIYSILYDASDALDVDTQPPKSISSPGMQ